MSIFRSKTMNVDMNKKVWDAISHIKTGMLITTGPRGLRTKPMYLVQDDYDGKIYFFVNINSSTVTDINEAEQVCVSFTSPKDGDYVSLYGLGKINVDDQLMETMWNPLTAAWFPQGMKTAALVEIEVTHGEYWKSDTSKLSLAYETIKANLLKTEPNIGEYTVFN